MHLVTLWSMDMISRTPREKCKWVSREGEPGGKLKDGILVRENFWTKKITKNW